MSALLDLSKVCRCCHSQGIFNHLNESFSYDGQLEIYSDMLRQAFNIEIKPSPNLSYSICEVCIPRLCDAFVFSRQVISCEQLIYQCYSNQYKDKDTYYKDEIKIEFNVEEFKTEVECQDCNSGYQNDDDSFIERDIEDQTLSTLKDSCEQIEPSEVNIVPSTKKKLRTEILDIKCVTTCSRLNKAPKTSAERGREFRARRALLKQQSKQRRDLDAIVEIATEDIRSADIRTIEKRAKSIEATRRWREKKRALMGHKKKQAKTAAQRVKEYRARKKLVRKTMLEQQREQDLDAVST